jgi:hypothetical protein
MWTYKVLAASIKTCILSQHFIQIIVKGSVPTLMKLQQSPLQNAFSGIILCIVRPTRLGYMRHIEEQSPIFDRCKVFFSSPQLLDIL